MAQVGSQSLGTFALGENAVESTVTAQASPAISTTATTSESFERELSLGDFSVGDTSLGESITSQQASIGTLSAQGNASRTGQASFSSVSASSSDSDSSSSSFSGIASAASLGFSEGTASTSTTVDGDVTTLVPATILGASGNSLAVGGETLRVDMSGSTSSVSSETESVSLTSQSSFSVNESSDVAGAKSTASIITFTGDTIESDVSTEAVSIAQTVDQLISAVIAGSVTTTVSESLSQNPLTSPLESGPFTSSTAEVSNQTVNSRTSQTVETAETTSPSVTSPLSATPFDSLSTSKGIGGEITKSNVFSAIGTAFNETVTSADNQTLVPATVLAASANTLAVGGETVQLNMSGSTSPVLSKTESTSIPSQSSFGVNTGPSIAEATSASLPISLIGSTVESDVSTESISFAQTVEKSVSPLLTDSVATATSESLLTPSLASSIESNSLSSSTAEVKNLSDELGTTKLGESRLGLGDSNQTLNSRTSQTTETAETVSDSIKTTAPSAPFESLVLSESTVQGEITQIDGLATLGTPFNETATSADNQTLVPATILGASVDTLAVGGETITVNGTPRESPVLSESTSVSVEASSSVSPSVSPSLSETLSESSLSRLNASVVGGSVLSESIGGLIQNLRSDPLISDSVTATVTDALVQQSTTVPFSVDPFTETVAETVRFDSKLGVKEMGSFSLGTPPSTQSSIASPVESISNAAITTEAQLAESSTAVKLSESVSEAIAGTITPITSQSFLADSQSASTGGTIQTLFGQSTIGTPFTVTDSDGDITTMVSGTVLAATVDTAAAGAEILSLTFSPLDSDVLTETISETVDPQATSTSLLSDIQSTSTSEVSPTTSQIDVDDGLPQTSVTSFNIPISVTIGGGLVVDPITETTGFAPPLTVDSELGRLGLGEFSLGNVESANQRISTSPVEVDPESETTGTADIISSQVQTLLSESLSASSGGNITTVGSTVFLAQADTSADSDGTVTTLVPATVLAASGDTAASGGETLKLTLAPLDVDGITSTVSDVPAVTNITATDQLGSPFTTTISDAVTSAAQSNLSIGEVLSETNAIGIKTKSLYNILTVDPESLAEAVVPDFTQASFTPLLSQSISQAIADVPAVTTLIGTPSEGIRFLSDWAISPGPRIIETTIEETREFDEMTLEFAADKELLINNVRPQIQNSGKLEIVPDTEGGFDAVDLASGTNRIELFPPTDHADVRPVEDWLIVAFEEQPLGTEAGYYNVELVVAPDKEKAYDNEYGTLTEKIEKTPEGDEWLFEFHFGDVATRRVTSEIDKTREGAIDTAELTLILTAEETRIVEESVSKLNAIKEIDVPDGDGSVRDTNSELRNTVNVTVPDVASDTLQSGEYVVTEWETVWRRGLSHEVTLTLKQ